MNFPLDETLLVEYTVQTHAHITTFFKRIILFPSETRLLCNYGEIVLVSDLVQDFYIPCYNILIETMIF